MASEEKRSLREQISYAIIMATVGWIMHMVFAGAAPERAGGTTTGWTKEQEYRFLQMPEQHDSVMAILRRIERDLQMNKRMK